VPVKFYFDVHVPRSIREQLRRKGVDVLTSQEDGAASFTDEDLLLRATFLGRVLFTQDIRFKALAESWQQERRPFAGLLYGHQSTSLIGRYIQDLLVIAIATDPQEWLSVVEHLPFR
jgi:predicted nuclease of predicted toxin-antitoxin system